MISNYKYLLATGTKATNTFISFYILRNSKHPRIDRVLRGVRQCTEPLGYMTCDSGAHSFFAEVPSAGLSASGHFKKSQTEQSPEVYFENYLRFLKQYHSRLDYFVELDIGELIGQDKVEAWRDRFKAEGLFRQCILCYHPSIMDLDYFRQMCRDSESKYIAVEGDRPKQRTGRLDYGTLIKIAREEGCKLHGFAMTKLDALERFPFYSVDSSSWKSLIHWGRSVLRAPKSSKQALAYERDFARTKEGKHALCAQEVRAWADYEDYITRLWRRRGVTWED